MLSEKKPLVLDTCVEEQHKRIFISRVIFLVYILCLENCMCVMYP